MTEKLDIPSISAVIAAASVVAGVIYYSIHIRLQTKVRQTDLVWRLYSDANSKQHHDAWIKIMNSKFENYDDLVEKHGQLFSGKPIPDAFLIVANFYEGVGVLLHRKLVDIDMIVDLLPTEMTWEKVKPAVEGMRKRFNEPRFYEWFEYLYNEVKKEKNKNTKSQ